jgi:hypothetical protein
VQGDYDRVAAGAIDAYQVERRAPRAFMAGISQARRSAAALMEINRDSTAKTMI